MMNPVEIIRKKRDGGILSKDEMEYLISGYVRGEIPEYQISSFLMATYFRGMNAEETVEFTNLMLNSGQVINLSSINGKKVDKHSTGGVGDKISLPLAPIVASCGVPVPMISGRGLGHTGGTLDKLESIPGFRTDLSVDEYTSAIKKTGVVMIGQTESIAPADKKMYALRDVTGTIECIPLIAGSIMSKKLAEGIDSLVLDIKTGRGAFMQTKEKAEELATALVTIGWKFNKPTIGFITNMDEPLGYAIGNWNEVVESIECLRGKAIPDVVDLTLTLGGAMVMLGGKASTIQEGYDICKESLSSGKAYDKFIEMVREQGGDTTYIENVELYPRSTYSIEVKSGHNGFITAIDSLELGFTSIVLGAGRMKVEDTIDPKAGITIRKKIGDRVSINDVLAVFTTDQETALSSASERILNSFSISSSPPSEKTLIYSIVDNGGIHDFHI